MSRRLKDKYLFIASIIFFCLFLLFAVAIFSPLCEVFLPFVTAFMLCCFFIPPVNALQKIGLKRTLAAILLYGCVIGGSVLFVFYALPGIADAAKEIFSLLSREAEERGFDFILNELFSGGRGKMYELGVGAVKSLAAVLVGAGAAFYIVADTKRVKKAFLEFVPEKLKPSLRILTDDFLSAFNAFFRGQAVIAAILFVMEGTLLFALKIPYAWVLGLMGGVLDIIPYVGAFVAFALMCAVTFISAKEKLVIFAVGFFIIQQIENNVISPKICADSLKLHPAAVILTLYVGSFGGFWGILLSVPLACVLKNIVRRFLQSII